MFSKGYRDEAVTRLENGIKKYKQVEEETIKKSETLFKKRLNLKALISEVEKYINTIANTPKEIRADVDDIKITLNNYQEILNVVKQQVESEEKKGKAGAAAGVAAGVGVAAFAPTAAMGIATTFGVASTGTAISALSGAAATNAALAWLGGGALAAGGAGMAGGSTLLALAGPLGWAIGGAGIVGSGLLMNGNNKKIAAEANKKAIEVNAQIEIHNGLIKEIDNFCLEVDGNNLNIQERLSHANDFFPSNYLSMTNEQKKLLGALVNITLAAAQTLNKTVGQI